MPEYLAPGVFVEEVSFRQKSIEGVSTSTTGFVGPTRFGPMYGEPPLLTSFADFERIYGGVDRLEFSNLLPSHNYLAQGVRAYFAEGGRRLYVARAYNSLEDVTTQNPLRLIGQNWSDGRARWEPTESPVGEYDLRARHPGAAGNMTVTFVFRLGQNILDTSDTSNLRLQGAQNQEVVYARTQAEQAQSPPASGQLYWLERYFDESERRDTFRLRQNDPNEDATGAVQLDQLHEVQLVTVSVIAGAMGQFGEEQSWDQLTFHPQHPRSLSEQFIENPTRTSVTLYNPLVFNTSLANGASIARALMRQPNISDRTSVFQNIESSSDARRTVRIQLAGGNDGQLPQPNHYDGDSQDGLKSALLAFEDLEDISIIAAPGSTANLERDADHADADAITRFLIAHCERMRYRVAVLDSVPGQIVGDVLRMRGTIDTTRAALYYPWLEIFDPVTESEILNPPSGHIAGIYARNDVDHGVHKSPANEVIRLALGFEFLINKAQQEALNPEGVNALRFFEGRGLRVWGGRTASSDPEWKYLNVRRYFAFLERSIERGTQWAVFENNGPVLWANVRQTIEDFLFNEWKENHLLGTTPEQAFFVRCDRTTITQNDLDNGRLICLVGVAALKPAEFVIFRIGQKTADSNG